MASYSLPVNFSRMLDAKETTGPASVIVESYSSTARWSSASLSFVSGIHGLSFHNDAGTLCVENLQQNSAIRIVIPLESNSSVNKLSV